MKTREEVLWGAHTRDTLAELVKQRAVVILPIGSIEQHALHLPVETDNCTAEDLACRAAQQADDIPVLVTPTIPFGFSLHHLMHPGAISLSVETVLHVLRDACSALVAGGAERILILSGHGGNRGVVTAAALELSHQLGRRIEGYCWFDLIPATLDAVREGTQPSIGHSGELETSVMLALRPEAVRRERMQPVDGLTDDPRLATAAKGERIVGDAVLALVKLLREMHAGPGRPKTFSPYGPRQ